MHHLYCITNNITNQVYIGYSKHINKRWNDHKNTNHWDQGKHPKLYKSFRKYGLDNFTFEILESCAHKVDILQLEKYFIFLTNSKETGFNLTRGGDGGPVRWGPENGMYGKTHSTKVKTALSKSASVRFKNKSYEDLYGTDRAIEIRKQKSNSLKQYCSTINRTGTNNPHSKTYHLIDPHNQHHTIQGNLRKFCKEHNLNVGAVINLSKGRREHYKGWLTK